MARQQVEKNAYKSLPRAAKKSTPKTPPKVAKKSKSPPKKSAKKVTKAYVVEKVLDKCRVGKTLHYLIKWKNYDHDQNSWEAAANCNCPDLIKEFEKEEKLKASGKKRPASTGSSPSSGPRAKKSRASAAIAEEDGHTPTTSRYHTRSSSAGIIKLKRNGQNIVDGPVLVAQDVSSEMLSPPKDLPVVSTSNEDEGPADEGTEEPNSSDAVAADDEIEEPKKDAAEELEATPPPMDPDDAEHISSEFSPNLNKGDEVEESNGDEHGKMESSENESPAAAILCICMFALLHLIVQNPIKSLLELFFGNCFYIFFLIFKCNLQEIISL